MKENICKAVLRRRGLRRGALYALKVLLGLVIIFPIIICILFALKTNRELMGTTGLDLLPHNPTLENFTWVMESVPIGTYLLNTFIQCAIVIVCQLAFCSCAAYALVFFRFKGKNLIFSVILMTMMIPADVVVITNYIQIQHWNLTDTHLGMALPALVGGMGIFLMRQFYLTIPRDLKDAADIDGCSDIGFFLRIAMPLSAPSMASLAIYEFIIIYNRYFWPLLVTTSNRMRTVQIGMAMLEGGEAGQTAHVLAGAALCIVPAVLVFIVGQPYLIKGMTEGSVKG